MWDLESFEICSHQESPLCCDGPMRRLAYPLPLPPVIVAIRIEVAIDETFDRAAESDACNWFDANETGWDVAVVDLLLDKGNGLQVIRRI